MTDQPDPRSAARPVGPCTVVIFGASGDLTHRKLLPALHNLAVDKLLPQNFAVVGMATRDLNDESFRQHVTREVEQHLGNKLDRKVWDWLLSRLHYVSGNFRDPAAYERLGAVLEKAAREHKAGDNILFYLSTPPSFFGEIVKQLGDRGLAREDGGRWRRFVVEKPFGWDLDSARALNAELRTILHERQIYRIDHYLGKETVQNILVFRFANQIFEPVWDHRYVDHVQITVAEQLGVEHRGKYYEEAGALRDMVPNHILQLLALIAMEPPASFEANAVRDEKGKVLAAIPIMSPEEVLSRTVRGQYGASPNMDGYRAEEHVAKDSRVETYVALKLFIDNWRWVGVPFYLRTGKRMPARLTEIVIQFKRVPFMLFRHTPVDHLTPNQIVISIQPNESIRLRFGAKLPGPSVRIGNVEMDFSYAENFGSSPATGYETLLYDGMNGDATLFQRADSVERGWEVVAPILDVWRAMPPRSFPNYAAGSWGPAEAASMLVKDGRKWRAET